jgi:lysophospholipase L1-like esterase
MISLRILLLLFVTAMACASTQAQVLTASNVTIEWKVVNRFRLFRDPAMFKTHESAWQQYLIHVRNRALGVEAERRLIAQTSILGTEHVLNDRYIPFSRILRSKYDSRGWAAQMKDGLCWSEKDQGHTACGGADSYVLPTSHQVEFRVKPRQAGTLVSEFNCEWRVNGGTATTSPCDEPVVLDIPYPDGGTVSVNVPDEEPVSRIVKIKDLLIVGLGDSFGSGEGNPDVPVTLAADRRYKNQYPLRARNDGQGNAQWTDETCHRSLYSHQLRAALQIAIENPAASVTFMGYACSGAGVDEGLLEPQEYVDYVNTGTSESLSIRAKSGGKRDTQLYRLLADLCREKPEKDDGLWRCPNNSFRRPVDYMFLSIGGNDMGFSDLVAWTTLRDSAASKFAKFFGATVSAGTFGDNIKSSLPDIYARLSKAIEISVPFSSGELPFDASRIVLSAYPDILEDETGELCAAGEDGDDEARFPANRSLDKFSSWLVVTPGRLKRAHVKLQELHIRMGELAEDHGWTFAGRVYSDKAFRGHGFCALDRKRLDDPAEMLRIPCWSKPDVNAQVCERSFTAGNRIWQPYDPSRDHFPYALRQRWVRTFNDAYMIVNHKVVSENGSIDERASDAVFAESTGAMHPTAEGQAAMADALMLDLREKIRESLTSQD